MKDIREIEAIIDESIEGLQIYEVRKHEAIILACQIYETYVNLAMNLPDIGVARRELVFDCQNALDILVRLIMKNGTDKGLVPDENYNSFKVASNAFSKCLEYSKAENLFLPYTKGLNTVEVLSDTEGEECIKFAYTSDEVAYYEIVNERLLSEYNDLLNQKLQKGFAFFHKLYKGLAPRDLNFHKSVLAVELSFDLPDSYRIGPYTIGQIKEVWYKVIREALYGGYENRQKGRYMTPNHAELLYLYNLNWETWNFEVIDKETTRSILDDLTFRLPEKRKKQFTSLLTEPILEMEDGSKFITPQFILNYQHSRNIIAALNRKYKDTASTDADEKEVIFASELSSFVEKYPNLKVASPVKLDDTDIDYLIYDLDSGHLVAVELKWLTEPATPAEIVSKDEDIHKGINIQLPKYEKGISNDVQRIMKNAFGETYKVSGMNFFVVTRIAIGSGLIERDPRYKVINYRMLKRALHDTDGKLAHASAKLQSGEYYPRLNVHFSELEEISSVIGGVKIIRQGHRILSDFSLNTPEDDKLVIRGIDFDLSKISEGNFVEVADGKYVWRRRKNVSPSPSVQQNGQKNRTQPKKKKSRSQRKSVNKKK